MRLIDRLFSATRDPCEAVRPLWGRVIQEARMPGWYREGGVADTLEGRFDMVTLVLALTVLRMERSQVLTPQTAPLTEIFVDDMDGQLRQSGVGDLMVGKQIGKLMATLGGRIGALRTAMAEPDSSLDDVILRNVTLTQSANVPAISASLQTLKNRLDRTDDAALMAGAIA